MVTESRGRSLLPAEASGEYRLNSSGDAIQLNLDGGALNGYLSRLGDRESDRGTPLTFFFSRTWIGGRRLGFETQPVHGVSFVFDGSIARGSAASLAEDGYYLLEGTLTARDAAAGTSQQRTISLKLSKQTP